MASEKRLPLINDPSSDKQPPSTHKPPDGKDSSPVSINQPFSTPVSNPKPSTKSEVEENISSESEEEISKPAPENPNPTDSTGSDEETWEDTVYAQSELTLPSPKSVDVDSEEDYGVVYGPLPKPISVSSSDDYDVVYGPLPKPKSVDSEAADSDSSSDDSVEERDGWVDRLYNLSCLQGDILSNVLAYYDTSTQVRLMNSWNRFRETILNDGKFREVYHNSVLIGRKPSYVILTHVKLLEAHLLLKLPLTEKVQNSSFESLTLPSFSFLQGPTLGLSIYDSRVGVLLLRAIKETVTGTTHLEGVGEWDVLGETQSFVGYICNPVLETFHMFDVPRGAGFFFLDFFKLTVDSTLRSFIVLGIKRILETDEHRLMAYSSQTQIWTDFGAIAIEGYDYKGLYSDGIYLNNCLFWPDNGEEYGLWFDLEHRKTSLVPMPLYGDTTDLLSCRSFHEFDGRLVAMVRTTSEFEFDIFELKDDCSGWVSKYHVNLSSIMNQESFIAMPDMDYDIPIVHFVPSDTGSFMLLGFEEKFSDLSQWFVYLLDNGTWFSLLELGPDPIFHEIILHDPSVFWTGG